MNAVTIHTCLHGRSGAWYRGVHNSSRNIFALFSADPQDDFQNDFHQSPRTIFRTMFRTSFRTICTGMHRSAQQGHGAIEFPYQTNLPVFIQGGMLQGSMQLFGGQDLGATLVEKVHEDLPNYARNCSCSHPTTPLKTSVLTPTKCSKITFFRTQLFSQKRPPRTTTIFKTIFLALKMVQKHPQKLWKKGLQDAEKYDKSGGGSAAEPRRSRRNHARAIFTTIFMTILRTETKNCGEKVY